MAQSSNVRVSVVMPIYNEGKYITNVIDALRNIPQICEIIAIDDHSLEEYAQFYKTIPGIKLVRHEDKNRGKVEGMRTGTLQAQGDYIFFVDADLIGLKREHVMKVLDFLPNYEIVKVARGADNGIAKWMGFTYLIGGENIIKKSILVENSKYFFDDLPWLFETNLNYYIKNNNVPFLQTEITCLNHRPKMVKYNFFVGLLHDIEAAYEIMVVKLKLVNHFVLHRYFSKSIKERRIIQD